MRLIDADALIKKLAENGSKLAFNDRAVFLAVSMLIANPSEIPTVDAVQVKRGRWMKCTNHYWEDRYKCSVCGFDTDVDTLMGRPIYTFCPFCGARMDGERKEE